MFKRILTRTWILPLVIVYTIFRLLVLLLIVLLMFMAVILYALQNVFSPNELLIERKGVRISLQKTNFIKTDTWLLDSIYEYLKGE